VSVEIEAILAAFVPALIWLAIVYSRDRYEREPKLLIARLFVSAIAAIVVAIAVERALRPNIGSNVAGIVIVSALGVGLIEEGAKFGVTFVLTRRNRNFNEPVDGMIYASAVALGFAAIETTVYILRIYHGALRFVVLHGYSTLIAQHVASQLAFHHVAPQRAFVGALGHLSWAGLVGYAYGRRVVGGGSRAHVVYAYLAAAGLHGAYDAFLGLHASTLAFTSLAVSLALYMRYFRHALAVSPFRSRQLRAKPPPPPQHVSMQPPRPSGAPAAPSVPPAPPRPDGWRATHLVPASGLPAWSRPDVTTTVMGHLAAGTEVQEIERAGVWAHVLTHQGWSGWVDARTLVSAAGHS
jgi:RsiW-degrading membrane proteinase PrsW (M82 family)